MKSQAMERQNSLVQEIRDLWSHAGVEVESVSGHKIKCRMPPYFQGVQHFTQSLEQWGAEIDLETSINSGTASVTFVVFGDPRMGGQTMAERFERTPINREKIFYMVVATLCLCLQIVNFLGGSEFLTRVGSFILNNKQ